MDPSAAFKILQKRKECGAHANECMRCDESQELGQLEELAPPPESLHGLSTHALVRLFLQQQERRVIEYRHFEAGFVNFLQVAEAQGYEALVASTTARFSQISQTVNTLIPALESLEGGAPFAQLIRGLQQLERDKLQLTAQTHIVRHAVAVDAMRYGEDGEEAAPHAQPAIRLRREELGQLAGQLSELGQRIWDAMEELRCELADMDED